MNRVYLIRHGKPSSSWGQSQDPDPGLNAAGRVQARAVARALMALPDIERPVRVVSSPLRRCGETAAPFARMLGVKVEIHDWVGEIPTPTALPPEARGPWLKAAFRGTWAQIEGDLNYDAWRRGIAQALASQAGTAVFSHYVAINGVVSATMGRDETICFNPDHTSVTVLDVLGGKLSLVSLGREAKTGVM